MPIPSCQQTFSPVLHSVDHDDVGGGGGDDVGGGGAGYDDGGGGGVGDYDVNMYGDDDDKADEKSKGVH